MAAGNTVKNCGFAILFVTVLIAHACKGTERKTRLLEKTRDRLLESLLMKAALAEPARRLEVSPGVEAREPSLPAYGQETKASWSPEKYIQFVLYTTKSYNGGPIHKQGYVVPLNNFTALKKSGFRPELPTKLIIHGYNSDYKTGPGEELLPAIFESPRYNEAINVILVNWADLAGFRGTSPTQQVSTKGLLEVLYYIPARNAPIVGNYISKFIKFLVFQGGTNPSLIHVIGHSLGAHVAGSAGNGTQPDFTVGRITALDPAAPCFETLKTICPSGAYRQIQTSDAHFVDAIHTCGQLLGMRGNVGHVDFYPNGGDTQPGCIWWLLDFGQCSHKKSIHFMAQSISRIGSRFRFFANECPSWDFYQNGRCDHNPSNMMGEDCDSSTPGTFMLNTMYNT